MLMFLQIKAQRFNSMGALEILKTLYQENSYGLLHCPQKIIMHACCPL